MTFSKHFKIFTVFSFLRLRSPDIKWYQWVYPSVISLLILALYHWAGAIGFQLDELRIIGDLNVLMGVLFGFYIAALAAVASFSNENLDKIMQGRTPTLSYKRNKEKKTEKLTRRRFLAILFGYCAVLSVLVYLLGVFRTRVSVSEAIGLSGGWLTSVAEYGFWGIYIWLASSLLVVTLLGLHYLVERIHRA